jgi:hypothetical protein
MSKAVKLSDASDERINEVISLFTEGLKTFKETCLELGLNEAQMRECLDEEYWNSTMQE